MNCRELIKILEEMENVHGNIEVDLCAANGRFETVADVTYNVDYSPVASINYIKNEGK